MAVIVAAVLVLFACTSASGYGTTYTGDGTYYGADGSGTCQLPKLSDDPLLVAALDNPMWDGSAWCGSCAHVKGPNGEVTVTIVDKCPECASGDLDFSQDAFEKLAPVSAGRVTISWEFVECSVSGNLQYWIDPGSNNWWFAIQPRNFPLRISKVEFKPSGSSTWYEMTRDSTNRFVYQYDNGVTLPLSMRITNTAGEVLTDNNVIAGSSVDAIANKVITGSVQFSTGTVGSTTSNPTNPDTGDNAASATACVGTLIIALLLAVF
eukprot:TRINITY_DN18948_c0_g1_i1.p1 TRINITY_DN18948_c0_g1~~TRINITY_DN18948_c0_g1_i1.p1  ORF type:complete len:265 (+),score=68.05 TRINITY_DN18948_c0_g1_i1:47-841(+)